MPLMSNFLGVLIYLFKEKNSLNDNGETRLFDLRPYLADRYYAPLKNAALFRSVKTTPLTIEWPHGIDMCPDELYYHSQPTT
jgi:hypothetical protein